MKKILLVVILSILLLFVILSGYLYFSTQTTQTGKLKFSRLDGKVTITRDVYGVPHIHAYQSDGDAFFALGYVHAQDRFWQMEFERRVAQGTLSEVFGKATIEQDKLLRTFGFYRAAQAAWPALDPHTQYLVHHYTEGVNAFLSQKRLPLAFKILHYQPNPWTDVDSLAWQKMMAFDLQNNWQQEVTNALIVQTLGGHALQVLKPDYPADAPTILSKEDLQNIKLTQNNIISPLTSPWTTLTKTLTTKTPSNAPPLGMQDPVHSLYEMTLGENDDPDLGSNNWVVAGTRSTTGHPLLANDPHLALQAPCLWYLVEIKSPHLHVIGASLPGMPGIVIGHNDHIAWGVTNVNPDVQDLYIEPENGHFQVLNETIKVRGEQPIVLPIRITPEGPIISDVSLTKTSALKETLALKWTALQSGDTTIQSLIKMDYAKNWSEFTAAMQDYVAPSQNFVYADIQGNIGYYLPGKIPIRNGWNNALPVPADPQHQWSGFIPFEQLPHVLNPPEQMIASANNKTTPDSYPYTISLRFYEPPYRIERILALLHAHSKLSMSDFSAIQYDNKSLLWESLKPYLLKTKGLDERSRSAIAILRHWQGNTDLSSPAATIFAFWYQELMKMPTQQLGFIDVWKEPLFIVQQLKNNGIYCQTPQDKTCRTYLSQTLQTAMRNLTGQLGYHSRNWMWASIHKAKFTELGLGIVKPLGWIWNRTIPSPGGDYTVNVGTYDNQFNQTIGPGYRQIINLQDFNHSLFIQSLGQSEIPFNTHYSDLMPLWREGQYIPMSSSPKDWGTTQTLTLIPLKFVDILS